MFTRLMIFSHSFSRPPLLIFIRMKIKTSHSDMIFRRKVFPKRKSYFNIFSIPILPSRPPPQRSSQPTEKTPKLFSIHSKCEAHKKSKFSYCGFIRRFFNYNVAYSSLQRAFFCVLCVGGLKAVVCVWSNEWKNVIFMSSSASHHSPLRLFVEPHRRERLNKKSVITFRASAIIMEMIHLLLH